MRACCVGVVVAVGLLVGVAAVGGTAAAQSEAPDCGTVSYDGAGSASNPYEVTNVSQLQCVGNASTATSLSDDFLVTQDIDANETSSWNGGEGFVPIADGSAFAGTFDGNGYTISGPTIDRSSDRNVGLFGNVSSGGTLTDVSLENADVIGQGDVGALAGRNEGTVQDSSATGQVLSDSASAGGLIGVNDGVVTGSSATVTVDGAYSVGGLIGMNRGEISGSSASGDLSGTQDVGGLVGNNDGSVGDSSATGNVSATQMEVGGLVGDHDGDITGSSAAGDVSGQGNVGGLVGTAGGSVAGSYAFGNVSGDDGVGGLVGRSAVTVRDSYAVGSVDGSTQVGGLVGFHRDTSAAVETSYAACSVSGTSDVGGLVGNNNGGSVTDSYWDVNTTDQSASGGGSGLTSADMTGSDAAERMTGFDFDGTWTTDAGTYPYLQATPQSPAPDPSCTFDTEDGSTGTEDGSTDAGGGTAPSISNYQVSVDGEELTVTFDSDKNLVDIVVEISGAETARLDREDFDGDRFEGFRATYRAGTDGQYTVELVSARDGAANDGAEAATFQESVSIDTTPEATPTLTPTATPEPETATAEPVTPETATATATATAASGTPTDTDEPDSTDTDPSAPAEGGGPGFGVAAALAALCAAGYVLRRRRG